MIQVKYELRKKRMEERMRTGTRLGALAVLFALGVNATPATAQVTTGTVFGTVKDGTAGWSPARQWY